ncbi:DUF4129 domain-containing protein [Aquibacillus halophilus]|nr:DUF4129 domain-containing protein [Aquibacillus halophilus]
MKKVFYMVTRSKYIVVKWLQVMVEFLTVFPILLLIAIYTVPSSSMFYWFICLSLLPLIGMIFRFYFTNKKQWYYVSFISLFSLVLPILFGSGTVSASIFYLLTFVFLYRGLLYVEQEWDELFLPTYMWVVGLPIYFSGYFLYLNVNKLTVYSGLILWSGIILIVLTLFITNHRRLMEADLSNSHKTTINRAVQRHNRIFIILTLCLALFITNFKVFQDFLYSVTSNIFRSLFWVLSLLDGGESNGEQPSPNEMQFFPSVGENEQSLLAVWFERIFLFIVSVLLILAIIMLVIYLINKLNRNITAVFSKVFQFLNRLLRINNQEAIEQEYVDEKEVTFDWDDVLKHTKNRASELLFNRLKRRASWDNLTNTDKVRYLYRQFINNQINNGYSVHPYHTPREILEEINKQAPIKKEVLSQLQESYEQARYGRVQVSDEKVKDLINMISNNK